MESLGQLEFDQIEEHETSLGKAVVKKIFLIPSKEGEVRILGCQIISGRINKLGSFNVHRDQTLL